jgi:hypothetical protein
MKTPIVPLETIMLLDAKMFCGSRNIMQTMDEFHAVLDACGWDEQDYERLVLNRIDGRWD